jgi:hypothetical protein
LTIRFDIEKSFENKKDYDKYITWLSQNVAGEPKITIQNRYGADAKPLEKEE